MKDADLRKPRPVAGVPPIGRNTYRFLFFAKLPAPAHLDARDLVLRERLHPRVESLIERLRR